MGSGTMYPWSRSRTIENTYHSSRPVRATHHFSEASVLHPRYGQKCALTALCYGCALTLILAITSARSLAQQPNLFYPLVRTQNVPPAASQYPNQAVSVPYYQPVRAADAPAATSQYPNQVISYTEPSADNRAGNVPAAQSSVREQGPYDYQTEIVRPIPEMAGDSNPLRLGGQPWTGGRRNAWHRTPLSRRSFGRAFRQFRSRRRPVAGPPALRPEALGPRELSRRKRHAHYKESGRRSTRLNSVCRRWGFRRDWASPSRRRRSRESMGNSSSARSPRRTRSRWS